MNNGSLIKTIMNPHKSLESLDAAITEMENTIDELRKANDKLREEHYKDDTIAALRKELDWYQYHSFVISEDEAKELCEILKTIPSVDVALFEHSTTSCWLHVQWNMQRTPRHHFNFNFITRRKNHYT